jgi:hypothetical protein
MHIAFPFFLFWKNDILQSLFHFNLVISPCCSLLSKLFVGPIDDDFVMLQLFYYFKVSQKLVSNDLFIYIILCEFFYYFAFLVVILQLLLMQSYTKKKIGEYLAKGNIIT